MANSAEIVSIMRRVAHRLEQAVAVLRVVADVIDETPAAAEPQRTATREAVA